MPMIQLNAVSRAIDFENQSLPILRDIYLSVQLGETISIMGPSGSGKSSLLHLLAGLELPTSGSIEIANHQLQLMTSDARAYFRLFHLGVIMQQFLLLDMLTVEENIQLPLALQKTNPKKANHKTQELLAEVGLEHRARHFPHQLSGGEQQRVAIARALVHSPSVILADEPTGNLDRKSSAKVMQLLLDLVEKSRTTLVLVTHDPLIAQQTNRQINLLDGEIHESSWIESELVTGLPV